MGRFIVWMVDALIALGLIAGAALGAWQLWDTVQRGIGPRLQLARAEWTCTAPRAPAGPAAEPTCDQWSRR